MGRLQNPKAHPCRAEARAKAGPHVISAFGFSACQLLSGISAFYFLLFPISVCNPCNGSVTDDVTDRTARIPRVYAGCNGVTANLPPEAPPVSFLSSSSSSSSSVSANFCFLLSPISAFQRVSFVRSFRNRDSVTTAPNWSKPHQKVFSPPRAVPPRASQAKSR